MAHRSPRTVPVACSAIPSRLPEEAKPEDAAKTSMPQCERGLPLASAAVGKEEWLDMAVKFDLGHRSLPVTVCFLGRRGTFLVAFSRSGFFGTCGLSWSYV